LARCSLRGFAAIPVLAHFPPSGPFRRHNSLCMHDPRRGDNLVDRRIVSGGKWTPLKLISRSLPLDSSGITEEDQTAKRPGTKPGDRTRRPALYVCAASAQDTVHRPPIRHAGGLSAPTNPLDGAGRTSPGARCDALSDASPALWRQRAGPAAPSWPAASPTPRPPSPGRRHRSHRGPGTCPQ
jgi:hypothetical protein